jgi:hypothetical protein
MTDITTTASTLPVSLKRSGYSKLIASNPNYFGNLGESSFKPVKVIQADTTYEQVTCLGFNPSTSILEAVVQIKQPSGYDGDSCTSGSYEYIRFYVDYGSGFEDLGYVAINVHDVPNAADCAKAAEKPLSFAASVSFQPKTNWCGVPVLPKVRAILSWQTVPPANTPNYNPVWGNHLDAHIQIKPRPLIYKEIGLNIAGEVAKFIPPEEVVTLENQPVPLPDPGPLDLAQLAQLYAAPVVKGAKAEAATAVPAHRFGFAEVQKVLAAPVVDSQQVVSAIDKFTAAGLNWQSVVAALEGEDANVSYEQLECLGLEGDPAAPRLVATLRIKQPVGYNGGLCTAGSNEYVAFWADWDDTCKFTYLNTVAIPVHDISSIPKDGLVYSVVLPVNLDPYRAPCDKPKIARVHAVLSWATPPSTTNPNALNYWGNFITTHVQIQPGTVPNPLYPTISILGGIPTGSIASDGYTVTNARFAGNNLLADSLGRRCPFGGVVEIQGPEFPGYWYKIQVRPQSGGAWQDVIAPLLLTRWDGTTYLSSPDPTSHFFPYQQYANNIENLLGDWETVGLTDVVWEVKLQIASDHTGTPVSGAVPDVHNLQLDNTAPYGNIQISSGGDCGQFDVGAVLNGTFVATDANFGSFSLYTLPYPSAITPSGGYSPTPASGSAWSLNTAGLVPCGYVIQLEVADLSIVNSAWGSHNWAVSPPSVLSQGFCLLEPGS